MSTKLLRIALVAGSISFPIVALRAQDPPPPESPPPAIGVFVRSADGAGAPIMIAAPPGAMGNAYAPGGGFGLPMALPSPMLSGGLGGGLNWLNDQNLLDELEVVESQVERLRDMQRDATRRRQEIFRALAEVDADKRHEFINEFTAMLNRDVEEQVAEILLPHQSKRLAELRLQSQMNANGAQALTTEELASMLGITDEQKKQLEEKQREVRQMVERRLEELRKEATDELMSVLTARQRQQLEKMLGETYEFRKPRFAAPAGKEPPKAVPRNGQ